MWFLTLKTDQLQLSLCVRTERDCNRGACIVFILESPQQSAQSQLAQSSQNCKLFVCFQSNIKVLTQTPQPDARTSQAASRPKLIPKLAKTLNIAIPSTSVGAQKRRERIRDSVKLPAHDLTASLDLASIVVKEGFFPQ